MFKFFNRLQASILTFLVGTSEEDKSGEALPLSCIRENSEKFQPIRPL